MTWQYHPLLVLFSLGGFVSVVVAGYCWQYIRTRGWSYLVASIGLLGFNNAVWVFAATVKTASTDLGTSLLFYKFEFLGLLPNTVVAVVLALAYVGKDRWLTRRNVALLSVIPSALVLLVVTNPGSVMIVDPTLIPAQGILAFEHEFPPLFRVYLAWLYGAVFLAILVLTWGAVTRHVPVFPALVAIVALLLPLVAGVLKTAGVYPPGGKGINVSPAASAFGISVLAFAIIRYRVIELVPIGRDRAIEVMTDGYLLVGPDGMIVDSNPAAAEMLGSDTSELRGRPVSAVVPSHEHLTEAESIDFERDGRTIDIRRSNVTRQNQDVGEMLLLRDVTEQRQQKRELKRTNERLEEFASVVSHDLRNPLNVAAGNVALEREKSDSEQLVTASNALERMEELIDDLLMLARQGRQISDTERVSLSSVADECWTVVESRHASLVVDSNLAFVADRDRLQQLLENLFRNAVEHGDDTVTIRVGSVPDADGFYIADDGPGIPDDQRDEVFEYGYSTRESGFGFGLAIVREIADAHGWSISVTASTDQGTRFEITGVEACE
jgi:signal transduction histidine kinase